MTDSVRGEELMTIDSGHWQELTMNDTVRSRVWTRSDSNARSDRPHLLVLTRTCVFSGVEGRSTWAVAGFDRTVRRSTFGAVDGDDVKCKRVSGGGGNGRASDCFVEVETEVDAERGKDSYDQ
jgi:hypothetical protein